MISIPRSCTVLYGLYVLASSWDLDLGSSRADTDSRRSGLKDRNRLEDLETWGVEDLRTSGICTIGDMKTWGFKDSRI